MTPLTLRTAALRDPAWPVTAMPWRVEGRRVLRIGGIEIAPFSTEWTYDDKVFANLMAGGSHLPPASDLTLTFTASETDLAALLVAGVPLVIEASE